MSRPEESQRKVLTGMERGPFAVVFRLAASDLLQKYRSAPKNQMVSSPFRYIPIRGHAFLPAQSLSGRSCGTIFLFSSTEV
jgi:hypothetical protein